MNRDERVSLDLAKPAAQKICSQSLHFCFSWDFFLEGEATVSHHRGPQGGRRRAGCCLRVSQQACKCPQMFWCASVCGRPAGRRSRLRARSVLAAAAATAALTALCCSRPEKEQWSRMAAWRGPMYRGRVKPAADTLANT